MAPRTRGSSTSPKSVKKVTEKTSVTTPKADTPYLRQAA